MVISQDMVSTDNVDMLLSDIQKELKAPKDKFNSFGKYKYRSTEGILEAVKKLLPKGAYLIIEDSIEVYGEGVQQRFYIRANAALNYNGETVSCNSYARESLDKKGMDDSQITGAASSYARKYALNGLFCIDDSKDADDMDNREAEKKSNKASSVLGLTVHGELLSLVNSLEVPEETITKWLEKENVSSLMSMSDAVASKYVKFLETKRRA